MKVNKATFDDLEALELLAAKARMIVVTQMGPRIGSLMRLGGQEIMFQDLGMKLFRLGQWGVGYGTRLWPFRDIWADEAQEVYRPDNDVCAVEEKGDWIRITGAVDPVSQIERGFAIRENAAGCFNVVSFITNRSKERFPWSGGCWDITAVRPHDCSIGVLLGDPKSNWDSEMYRIVRRWSSHQTEPEWRRQQLKFYDDLVVVEPHGFEGKIMVQSPQGVIVVRTADTSFFKVTDGWKPESAGLYPGGVYNTAVYTSPFRNEPDKGFAEAETMGAKHLMLEAGQTLEHLVRYGLTDKPFPWEDAEGLRLFANQLKED
ncbi:MAG: hypothetical protein WC675_03730 [Patescibacteria group bacterium]|jgi:hypothetical protein